MKSLRYSGLLLALIFLTACPYESSVPITAVSENIDEAFLGKWVKEGEQDQEFPSEYYEITGISAQLYEISKNDLNNEDSTYRSETYISHISTLQKDDEKFTFLNMKKDGKYYLHKVDLDADKFVLYEVTDNIDDQFSSSEELRTFVEKHMDLSFFYNKDEATFYRAN